MKKMAIVIIIFLLTTGLFCQESGSEAPALSHPPVNTDFQKNSVIIGLDFSFGLSRPLLKIIPDSETKITPYLALSGNFMLFFTDNTGIQFNLGANYFKLEETLSAANVFIDYTFIYVNMASSVFFRYKRFFFNTGFYTGILILGKTETASGSSKSTQPFNRLDFGLTLGVGFILGNPAKTLYHLGFEVQYQLSNFKKNEINGSQVFSFYFKFGFLFHSGNALR